MLFSDPRNVHTRRAGHLLTAGLTAAIVLLMLGVALLVPLSTRNASGETRKATAFDIWRKLLDNLPPDAPFFLNQGVLTTLVLLALVGMAYVIVAIVRLSR